MRKSLFVLASLATWATINQGVAQYVYPTPGYVLPPPTYIPPPAAPGYMGREQRFNRTSPVQDGQQNYETQRTLNNGSGAIGVTDQNAGPGECARGFSAETCLRRENALQSGAGGLTDPNAGECAKGFSEETCRRRGQVYNPPRQN
jgi:hypothetical protein